MRAVFASAEDLARIEREYQAIEGAKQHVGRLVEYVEGGGVERERHIEITRIFAAPRALVFKAWTTKESLARWYAPDGCTVEILKMDFRTGGEFHLCIHNPSFGSCWCLGTYGEIVDGEKITYLIGLSDREGNRVSSTDAGHDADWPPETTVTVTFADHPVGTELTLQQNALESVAKRTGAYPSWLQMLEHLAEELRD